MIVTIEGDQDFPPSEVLGLAWFDDVDFLAGQLLLSPGFISVGLATDEDHICDIREVGAFVVLVFDSRRIILRESS